MSWYTGIHIAQDLDVDVCSATNKCKGCDHNNGGYCSDNKKWAYLINDCKLYPLKKEEIIKPYLVGIIKMSVGVYEARFTHKRKTIYAGRYKTEKEAIKALAKKEIEITGSRKRNLHIKI